MLCRFLFPSAPSHRCLNVLHRAPAILNATVSLLCADDRVGCGRRRRRRCRGSCTGSSQNRPRARQTCSTASTCSGPSTRANLHTGMFANKTVSDTTLTQRQRGGAGAGPACARWVDDRHGRGVALGSGAASVSASEPCGREGAAAMHRARPDAGQGVENDGGAQEAPLGPRAHH